MALDRDSIQKHDFPVGDGGYDRAAVDAHLSQLADQVEELKRTSEAPSPSLADTASDRIRAIIEGAETSAAEIQRHAVQDADRIRADAGTDAAAIRQQAKDQAHADIGKVNESTGGMISRLEVMNGELNALLESLRSGADRLKSELEQLEGHMGQLREATGAPYPPAASDAVAPEEMVQEGALHAPAPTPPQPEPVPGADGPQPVPGADGPEPVPESEAPAAFESPSEPDEAEGARLIALNMALNGTPREETDRYLAEHYKLNDRDGLLDEIYASVEG